MLQGAESFHRCVDVVAIRAASVERDLGLMRDTMTRLDSQNPLDST